MSASLTDPFALAWTILRPLKIGPDPGNLFVPPSDIQQLRSARAHHQLHQIMRAITLFMDKLNSQRAGSIALEKALNSINSWKSEDKVRSPLVFALRQWRLSNWVIDVQEAQKSWEEEVRALEICAHAMRTALGGIIQLPSNEQQALQISCEVLQLQLSNRIDFDRKCLHNSEKLVLLRQQIMGHENARHALDVLKQWDAET